MGLGLRFWVKGVKMYASYSFGVFSVKNNF